MMRVTVPGKLITVSFHAGRSLAAGASAGPV